MWKRWNGFHFFKTIASLCLYWRYSQSTSEWPQSDSITEKETTRRLSISGIAHIEPQVPKQGSWQDIDTVSESNNETRVPGDLRSSLNTSVWGSDHADGVLRLWRCFCWAERSGGGKTRPFMSQLSMFWYTMRITEQDAVVLPFKGHELSEQT